MAAAPPVVLGGTWPPETPLDGPVRRLRADLEALGFAGFTYAVLRGGGVEPPHLTTYPAAWAARYVERAYVDVDPVLLHLRRTVQPFAWSQAQAGVPPSPALRAFLGEAAEVGLGQGITVPIYGPGGEVAALSVAVADGGPDAAALAERGDRLHALALRFHDALRPGSAPTLPALPPREREVLLWAARGKTAWETGEILGLAEQTVVGYLKSAIHRLDTANKTHAVVRALLHGLIAP